MALEKAYPAALEKVATYDISGDTLELRTAEGKVGLRYAVAEAPALTRTRWVATTINNGKGATVSVVAGLHRDRDLRRRRHRRRHGGCNTTTGRTRSTGAHRASGRSCRRRWPAPTRRPATQEAAYLAALDKVTTFAFNGDNLELRDADGALQASYRATQP